jgi:hypothetical protein
MGIDAPRNGDRIAETSDRTHPRRDEKNRLLALAGALADLGIRARLVEYYLRPTVLRCWEPDRMGPAHLVTCERPTGPDPRWEFRHHPSGEVLADAEDVAEPGDAREPALVLSVALAASQWRG